MLVTHTVNTLYCVGTSFEHRSDWMLHVWAQLEVNFANGNLAPYRVHKVTATWQLPSHDGRCDATRKSLSLHAAHFCPSWRSLGCTSGGSRRRGSTGTATRYS